MPWSGARPRSSPISQRAVNHDYAVVFPVAAVIILLILALVLRSVVALWYLMASVGLGFGATLGASVLVFQGLRGERARPSGRPG
jgi:RND superfamily putative drug exporter